MKQSFQSLRQALALLVLLCLNFNQVSPAQTTASQPSLLWKITGNGLKKPSYLYGTFHLVPSGYLPAEGEVMAAFLSAKGVIVEIEMDSAQLMRASMLAIMSDHRLSQLLAPQDYAVLDTAFQVATGYALKPFEQVKPVALSLMLSIAYNQQAAPWLKEYQGAPLDMYFQQEGRRLGKHILALETVEEQLRLLYGAETVEAQAQDLLAMVRDHARMRTTTAELVEGWRTQDLARMQAASDQMMDSFGSPKELLNDRNDKWMAVLPKALKKGPQFIAVGALHLAGEDGLVQQLRDLGYTVEPQPGR